MYHGSIRKIKGEKLLPRQARDLEENPESMYKAVYATDVRDAAIGMALISCKGIDARLNFRRPFGVIYRGWPKQEYIYLYSIPQKTFIRGKKYKHEFYSFDSVKPFRIEKLKVKDHLHLIRKASEKEKRTWFKKYGTVPLDLENN